MRNRIWMVVCGVLLGMACRWVFGTPDEQDSVTAPSGADERIQSPAVKQPAKSPDTTDTSAADPLIPPAVLSFETELVVEDPFADVSPAGLDHHVVIPGLTPEETAHDARAIFEPHGNQVCASGCAASNHPTKTLTLVEFQGLLAEFAHDPISEDSLAFETLLYYGSQTRRMLRREGYGPLDAARRRALDDELSQTHVKVSIRVTDSSGAVRSHCDEALVPLDRRHVFLMEVNDLQPLVTSGTVKRNGVDKLWVRL